VLVGSATFALSRTAIGGDGAIAIGAIYGAASITLAVWCVAAVVSLAGSATLKFIGADITAQKEPPCEMAGRSNAFVIEQTNRLITPAPAVGRRPGEHPARPGSRSGR
jgi:hypothetical protein